MREILFRAKRLDNGEWVFGYLTKMWNTCHIQDSENDIICNHYDSLYPEEETMVLIVWDNFGWKIKESSSAEEINTAIDIENCEVVGNIFDNPELLGGLTDGN